MAKIINLDTSKLKNDRVHTEVVIDVPEFKLVHFYLKAGQKVSLHASKSNVLTTVLKGKGKFFIGNEGNKTILNQGESIYYESMEPHGFEAIEDMIVEAFISPNPVPKINLK